MDNKNTTGHEFIPENIFRMRNCQHEWKLEQEWFLHKSIAHGPDQVYDLYKCVKCGKTEARERK